MTLEWHNRTDFEGIPANIGAAPRLLQLPKFADALGAHQVGIRIDLDSSRSKWARRHVIFARATWQASMVILRVRIKNKSGPFIMTMRLFGKDFSVKYI